MEYTDLISREELNQQTAKRGYDFAQDNVLDASHFSSVEDAMDDLFQEALDSLEAILIEYRGRQWTKAFLEDMTEKGMEGAGPFQREKHDLFMKAYRYHIIFLYDCGNSKTQAEKDNNNSPYGQMALDILWNNGFLM